MVLFSLWAHRLSPVMSSSDLHGFWRSKCPLHDMPYDASGEGGRKRSRQLPELR